MVSAFTLTLRFAWSDHFSLRSYAIRRIARIGPAFWLAALGYALLAGLGPRSGAPNGLTTADILTALVFGNAWSGGAAQAVVPGGWSISCEFAFYAWLPIAVWATRLRVRSMLVATVLSTIVAQLLSRGTIAGLTLPRLDYANPVLQMPVFMFGMCAACFVLRFEVGRTDAVALGSLVIAIVVIPFTPIHGWYLQQHLQFALVASVAVGAAAMHAPALLSGPFIRKMGEVSFSLYLIHFALLAPILYLINWIAPRPDWLTFILYFISTTATAFFLARVTHRYIERPAIVWAATATSRAGSSRVTPFRLATTTAKPSPGSSTPEGPAPP